MSKEAMKLALEGAANYIDALGGDSRKYRQALAEQPAQQEEPVRFKCTVVDDAHPNGVPLSKWGQQKPLGLFLTREQAIQFCRKRRPDIEPTEQHIAATIDAYAALFGDMVEALMPPQRTWVGLSDEEKRQLFDREDYQGWLDYINAIEAKLKEKNT